MEGRGRAEPPKKKPSYGPEHSSREIIQNITVHMLIFTAHVE